MRVEGVNEHRLDHAPMKPSHPRACIFPVTGKDGQHDDDGLCDYCRAQFKMSQFKMSAQEVIDRQSRKLLYKLRVSAPITRQTPPPVTTLILRQTVSRACRIAPAHRHTA